MRSLPSRPSPPACSRRSAWIRCRSRCMPAEGRFSMKSVVATALTHGSVRLAAFEPSRMTDKGTRALMERVSVGLDPELDAVFPRQRAARVAITARGRREELVQPHRKGDPEMPLSDAELEDKFSELASPLLGPQGAQSLLARLWKLECA